MNKNLSFYILTMLCLLFSGCALNDSNRLPRMMENPAPYMNFPLNLEWATILPNRIIGMAVAEKSLTLVTRFDNGLELQTLDLQTGARIWEKRLNQGRNGENSYTNIQIQNSMIFVTYANEIYAFDAMSGVILWKVGGLESNINKIMSFSNKNIIVVDVSRKVLAYDIETGEIAWVIKIDRGTASLFAENSSNIVYFFQDTLAKAIYDEDGRIFWEHNFAKCSARAYWNQILYCTIGNEGVSVLEAYNLSTKSIVWKAEIGTPNTFLSFNDKGIERLIGQSDKTLTSIDINSGKKDWEYTLPTGYYRMSVVLDRVVYTKNFYSGRILAFDLQDGEFLGYLELKPKDEVMLIQADDLLVDPSDSFLVLYHMNQVFVYKSE